MPSQKSSMGLKFNSPMITFLQKQGIDFTKKEHQHFKLTSKGFMDLTVECWHENKSLFISL